MVQAFFPKIFRQRERVLRKLRKLEQSRASSAAMEEDLPDEGHQDHHPFPYASSSFGDTEASEDFAGFGECSAEDTCPADTGPMPGVRPPMGGAGGMIPPSQGNKGSGAMGVIMPLYTVGIIIFFVYTIMKVLFKKGNEDTAPKLKDFHLDPEYRKYVFAEEYMDKSNANYRQQMRRRDRDDSRGSRKRFHEPDTKIGSSSAAERMDTGGKELGEWYLPEGFVKEKVSSGEEDEGEFTIGGTTVEEAAKETVRDRLFDGGGFLPKMKSKEDEKKKKRKKRPYKRPFRYRDITCDDDISQYAREIEMEEEEIMKKVEKDMVSQKESRTRLRKQDLEGRGGVAGTGGHKSPVLDPTVLYSDEFLEYLRTGLKKFQRFDDVNQESFIEACRLARDLMESGNPVAEREHDDELTEEEEEEEREEKEQEVDRDIEENEKSQTSVSQKQEDDWSGGNLSPATPSEELLDHFDTEDDDGETLSSTAGFSLIEDASSLEDDQGDPAAGKSECDKKDEQMTQLRRRLEETEKAMERLMDQMGTVTDKLTAAKITEVLTQAQAQAKILKSEEENKTSSKGSSPDMDDYEVINKEDDDSKLTKELATSGEEATQGKKEVEEAPHGDALPSRDTDESLQETRQEDTSAATTGHEDNDHDDDHDAHDDEEVEEEEETNAQGGQGSEEEGVAPLQDATSSSGTGSTVQEIPPTERWSATSCSKEDDPVTTPAATTAASAAAATISQVAVTEDGDAEEGRTMRTSRSADDDVDDSLAKEAEE